MLNELPLYTDLQKLLKDYAKALEDAIMPHVLDAFPKINIVDLSILENNDLEINASITTGANALGTLKITLGKPTPIYYS